MPEDASTPVLSVKGNDPRARMFDQIARVHKQLVEAKWRARTANRPVPISPSLVIHCEEAITFLAGEVLALRALVEKNEHDSSDCESVLVGGNGAQAACADPVKE